MASGKAGKAASSSAQMSGAVADSIASTADLTRVAQSVFGDASGIESSAPIVKIDEPEWDIDVRSYETHERVAYYVRLFSGSARDRFLTRLSRGTRYDPMIRAKLRAGGLPEDMTYLALVESGYDPNAYSRAAAVGMWQFMSSTARDIGMRVDWWVDERRDPALSTDGAIRFLRELQGQFGGSLYLAAAAYNGGPGRVSRGLTRFADEMEGSEGEDRFFALAQHDYLRAETKDYVPQLIAAALVAKMPAKYGVVVDTAPPYAYDSVHVEPGTSLAAVSAASGATTAEVRDLNPSILRGVTPPDLKYWVKVPAGRGDTTRIALEALPEGSRRGYSMRSITGSKTTLASIAAETGVSAKAVQAFNPGLRTSKAGRLIAGQNVRLPVADAVAFLRDVPNPSIEIYGGSASRSASSRASYHVVRRGESLGAIANRYSLSVSRLKALNGLRGSRVIAGQTLRIRTMTASRTISPKSAVGKSKSGKAASAKSKSKKSKSAKSESATAATAKSRAAKSMAATPEKKAPPAKMAPSKKTSGQHAGR